MKPPGIITLTTDFGTRDPFVGVMKGAILTRFPEAKIIDICHEIAPQVIEEAAFWIERSYRYFPRGTVHLVIVDPGVGSARGMIAIRADEHYFIGPDNGVFTRVWETALHKQARSIDTQRLGLKVPSSTFHGRDVFGPVAAWIAAWRLSFGSLAPMGEPLLLPAQAVEHTAIGLSGTVLTIDRYGNAFTNIQAADVAQGDWGFMVKGRAVPFGRTYADVPAGECVALVNSFGVVEIAERNGSAERSLGIVRGDTVLARPSA
jgi:S-adenosylmethionine hydrolase